MKASQDVYVTDWGTVLDVGPDEFREAGLSPNEEWAIRDWGDGPQPYLKRTLLPKKNAALLHDFLTYYARDDCIRRGWV